MMKKKVRVNETRNEILNWSSLIPLLNGRIYGHNTFVDLFSMSTLTIDCDIYRDTTSSTFHTYLQNGKWKDVL